MVELFLSLAVSACIAGAVAVLFWCPNLFLKSPKAVPLLRQERLLCVSLALGTLLVFCDALAGLPERLATDAALSAFPLFVVPSTSKASTRKIVCYITIAGETVSILFSLLCGFGLFSLSAPLAAAYPLSVFVASLAGFLSLFGKNIVDFDNAPSKFAPLSLSALSSDIIYVCLMGFLLLWSGITSASVSLAGGASHFSFAMHLLCFFLSSLCFVGSILRRSFRRNYLLLGKYEEITDRLVASYIISREAAQNARENLYGNLFNRIDEYFRTEQPFLNPDFCLMDVSRRMLTNKLYVSKAIGEYSGGNFSNYVNTWRVRYSMECFRENPDLRIADLSDMSGFSTLSSYIAWFKKLTGELPSEWTRRTASAAAKRSFPVQTI